MRTRWSVDTSWLESHLIKSYHCLSLSLSILRCASRVISMIHKCTYKYDGLAVEIKTPPLPVPICRINIHLC